MYSFQFVPANKFKQKKVKLQTQSVENDVGN